MLFLSLIVLIICKALQPINMNLSENGYGRITAIICLFCAILTFNSYSINGLDSGVAIYGGLFHITNISQILEQPRAQVACSKSRLQYLQLCGHEHVTMLFCTSVFICKMGVIIA